MCEYVYVLMCICVYVLIGICVYVCVHMYSTVMCTVLHTSQYMCVIQPGVSPLFWLISSPRSSVQHVVSHISSIEGYDPVIHSRCLVFIPGVPHLAELSLHCPRADGCHANVCAHQVMPCCSGESLHKMLGTRVNAATCMLTLAAFLYLSKDWLTATFVVVSSSSRSLPILLVQLLPQLSADNTDF